MNQNDLKNFRIIGKMHASISSSKKYDEAVTACLKIILENSMADYAVIWKADRSDTPVLYPMYWICPVDLSSHSCPSGIGIVGKAFENKRTETVFDCRQNAEQSLLEDFSGIDISSVTCIPLFSGDICHGCVQFIKSAENGLFTQDDVDTCELLAMMAQMELEAEAPLENYAPPENILLSVKNNHKYFQNGEIKSHILKGINLDIYEGEFICLLGESGCGKSTFLNIIGGLERADSGTFTFCGKEYQNASEDELTDYRRKNIGFVFQSYNLMPNLTAKQNLDLIGELVDEPMNSAEALKVVGLADKINSYPSQLSGGQQQRISIARAIVKKPKVIMADEPTAALDYKTSIEVLEVFADVVKNGTTLIMVTHNEEITKMADRVVRFRNGKVYEVTINRNPKKASELVW